jgi:hypothetical protein
LNRTTLTQTESFIPGKDASLGGRYPVMNVSDAAASEGSRRVSEFFGLETLGVDMEGSAMHRTLLAAHDKAVA